MGGVVNGASGDYIGRRMNLTSGNYIGRRVNLTSGNYIGGSVNLDMSDYLAMVQGKTGALFGAASEVGALCAGVDSGGEDLAREFYAQVKCK